MDDDIRKLIRKYGESVDISGRMYEDYEIEEMLEEYSGTTRRDCSDFVIDSTGRIYHQGVKIGWVDKLASAINLQSLAAQLNCWLPSGIIDMKSVVEVE